MEGFRSRPEHVLLDASSRFRFKLQLPRVANYGMPNPLIEFAFGNTLFWRF
jgi:hypothetical protein